MENPSWSLPTAENWSPREGSPNPQSPFFITSIHQRRGEIMAEITRLSKSRWHCLQANNFSEGRPGCFPLLFTWNNSLSSSFAKSTVVTKEGNSFTQSLSLTMDTVALTNARDNIETKTALHARCVWPSGGKYRLMASTRPAGELQGSLHDHAL